MYKINRIEKMKQKGIYKIHFNNCADLLVHEDVLLEQDVLLKNELSSVELNQLEEASSFSAAYYEAINFISRKLRSKHEVMTHLSKKEFNSNCITRVVAKLEMQGYLNDLNYAISYANTVLRTTTKGIDHIKKNLNEHQIDNEFIAEAIDNLDYSMEYDKLYKLVNKKIASNKKYSKQVLREKLFYEFKTKGFETSLINQVFSEVDFSISMDKLQKEVDKLMRKHKDIKKVKHLLKQKGFSNDQIENAIMKEGLDGIY